MASRNLHNNTVLIVVLFAYIIFRLPIIYSILVIISSVLGVSVLRKNQDFCAFMFAYVVRFITRLRRRNSPVDSIRSDILKVCASVNNYPVYMESILQRKKKLFFMLDRNEQELAKSTYLRLKEVEKLVKHNEKFLKKVKDFAMKEFKIDEYELYSVSSSGFGSIELIEHFVRDWSVKSDSVTSRQLLIEKFKPWAANRKRILVPGSGLGRLAADIANIDSSMVVDALELSASMYLGSKFASSQAFAGNLCRSPINVYPYLYHFSNWRHGSDQLEAEPLHFTVKSSANFLYENFLNLKPDTKYDAVFTLFFIDTAQNIFEYINQIHNVLDDEGIWCNYGPLKWGTAAYAELSVDELLEYIKKTGWQIVELWDEGTNRYNGSRKSMLDTKYRLIGWVAKKQKVPNK